jgi:predicted lipoprotein with Yx(FWY)xxD motif
MIRTRKAMALSVATAGLALIAACGDSGKSNSTGQAPAATGAVVSAQPTSLGTILVDGKGRTVYVFANDKTNASTCTGSCATDWPPVSAPAQLPATVSGVTGALGTTTRTDGSHQLTVAGHPVYTFSGDSAAGQTNGQGLTLNGGLWTVVLPSGAPDPHPSGTGAANPGPGAGY